MKIRLRGKQGAGPGAAAPTAETSAIALAGLQRTVSPRRGFLKLLATGAGVVGAAGLGQIVIPPRSARADFVPGSSMDTVTKSLKVEGSLQFADLSGAVYRDNWVGMVDWIEGTKKWLHVGGITDDADGVRRLGLFASRVFVDGNVGIGTLAPALKLHVYNGQIGISRVDSATYRQVQWFDTGGVNTGWAAGLRAGDGSLHVFDIAAGLDRVVFTTAGQVNVAAGGVLNIGSRKIADQYGAYYA